MALVALVTGAVVLGSSQLSSSRLRRSSTLVAGAIRVGFARATSMSKSVRLVIDFAQNELWLEESEQPMLVQSRESSGTGGATAVTEAEKRAVEEGARIVKGVTTPRPSFREVDAMGVGASQPGKGHRTLDRGIAFRKVQTAHDDVPKSEGRAYLYFWPGGQTERAAIQLQVGREERRTESESSEGPEASGAAGSTERPRAVATGSGDVLTLIVAPLTGKTTVRSGAVDLPTPTDDKDLSERAEPGAF